MNTGKTIKLDPRSAPDKAPAIAPSTTEKQMPEYPMDRHELVYPGAGSPFPVSAPEASTAGAAHRTGTPAHPAAPPTEVPRNRHRHTAVERRPLLAALQHAAAACELALAACRQAQEPGKYAECMAACRACLGIFALQAAFLEASADAGTAMLANDLSPVCARACEACAMACGKHPEPAACMACAKACRAAAEACRSFAGHA